MPGVPSGEVGRFEVDDHSSPPADRNRSPNEDRRERLDNEAIQQTGPTITKRLPSQFSIKDLLIATFLVAVMAVSAPIACRIAPEWRVSIFWIMTVLAGVSARWIGWRMYWPPGSVGRHAVAFFFATTGSAAMVIFLNYDDSLPRLIRDIPDGLGAAALLHAIFIAAITESTCWLFSNFRADIIESGSLHAKTLVDQSDQREPK